VPIEALNGNGMKGAANEWILALDIGSSSVRARFYSREGGALDPGPGTQIRYRWSAPREGVMEYDPRELLGHVTDVLDAAVQVVRHEALDLSAVAVATFWHGLMGLDARGAPATPLFGWGDTRAATGAAWLRERIDEAGARRRTGCPLRAVYPSAKLAWLRRERPRAFARVAAWVSIGEYLEEVLSGRRRCTLSMASATGLLNVGRLEWDGELLEVLGLSPDRFSPLADADEPLHGLGAPFDQRWPELAEIPWFPAVGDGACANLGSGAVGPGRPALTIGTTTAARVLLEAAPEEPLPDDLWCYLLDRRRRVVGGALSNGGNAIARLLEVMGLEPTADLDQRLRRLPPDAHGLTVIPELVGERASIAPAGAGGAVVGIRVGTTPQSMVQAWMEAIAYGAGDVHRRLETRFGASEYVLASGGALHAFPTWVRILADVLGRPVRLGELPEASSRGAALLAAESLGWIPHADSAPEPPGLEFGPNRRHHNTYEGARERQRQLVEALVPWTKAATPPRGAARHT
jgi:gluconokinase